MLHRKALATLAALLLAVTPALAQDDAPEAVAQAYLEARLNGSAAEAAQLVHPDQQRALGAAILRIVQSEGNNFFLSSLIPPDDADAYAGLSDQEAYALYNERIDARNEERRTDRGGYQPTYSIEALGHVQERDTLHVLVRTGFADEPETEIFEVVSLRETGNGNEWGVLLPSAETAAILAAGEDE